jgi:hypothetical protein
VFNPSLRKSEDLCSTVESIFRVDNINVNVVCQSYIDDSHKANGAYCVYTLRSKLLQLTSLALFFPQLLGASDWTALDRLLATDQLEAIVEQPLGSVLDGLIEHVRQEWDSCETELHIVSKL